MKKFRIMASTDGYTASRDAMFRGKTEVTLERGLTLKEAQEKLLDMFNKYYSDEYYAENWGLAVIMTSKRVFGASSTYKDGTRAFTYDGRRFYIEEAETITMQEFAKMIEDAEDWKIEFSDIIKENGWNDETYRDFGICSDGKTRLVYDDDMENVIIIEL